MLDQPDHRAETERQERPGRSDAPAYTLEQARMRLREAFETSEWPKDGTDLEYFIRRAFPDVEGEQ